MRIKSNMVDTEIRRRGEIFKILNPAFSESRFRFANRFLKKGMKVKDKTLRFSEDWIARKDGSKIRVCIFGPLNRVENVPGVLWLHGGGYAMGVPEQSMVMAKRFIQASNCIVIAPDYRLSVEAPYPAAFDDCYEALLWMKNHAKALGIRDDQLMVGGDSAGGGLTAALTLRARDTGEVAIAFQMPLYPMIDDRMTSESSMDNDAPVWNSKSNLVSWKLYLGKLFGTPDVPCYAAPGRAKAFDRLPPAVTFVGDLEPFRDETIEYVESLRKAGVPVDFQIYKGCYHGFDTVCPKAEVSKKAVSFLMNAFTFAVSHCFAEQKQS
jgi:acetyl esterase/lipase